MHRHWYILQLETLQYEPRIPNLSTLLNDPSMKWPHYNMSSLQHSLIMTWPHYKDGFDMALGDSTIMNFWCIGKLQVWQRSYQKTLYNICSSKNSRWNRLPFTMLQQFINISYNCQYRKAKILTPHCSEIWTHVAKLTSHRSTIW